MNRLVFSAVVISAFGFGFGDEVNKTRRRVEETCTFLETTDNLLPVKNSPIFSLPFDAPEYSIIDLLNSKIEEIREGLGLDVAILVPEVVREGDEDTVDSLGGDAGVTSCESLDYLESSDALVFGYENAAGQGLCAAVNPCEDTYAIGQSDILPPVSLGIITLTLDTISFSLNKGLSSETLNDMWDGEGDPAPIEATGHIVIGGTGELGIRVSSKVSATISLGAKLLIDADNNNDGLDTFDMAILISGEMTAVLTVTSCCDEDGQEEEEEIDLSGTVTDATDLYVVVTNGETQFQYARSLNVLLSGICDQSQYLALICDIFEGDSQLTGAVRVFADATGAFGLMFALEGEIALRSDFEEDFMINSVMNWPSKGNIVFSISLAYTGAKLKTCAKAEGFGKMCFSRCTKHSQCESNEFCDPLGFCRKRFGVGIPCLADRYCKSNSCNGVCTCGSVDSTRHCPEGKFCSAGLACEPQRSLGEPCSSGSACKSGHCSGVCVQCKKHSHCNSDYYCAIGRCKAKLGKNKLCFEPYMDKMCRSNKCKLKCEHKVLCALRCRGSNEVVPLSSLPVQNLIAINRGPITGSGNTEAHVLDGESSFLRFNRQIATSLHTTDGDNWDFVGFPLNGNIVGIKMADAVEVHVLASPYYKNFVYQVVTPIGMVDPKQWKFAMSIGGNLFCIFMGPMTGTRTTEIHILSFVSGYQAFIMQTGTALPLSYGYGEEWDFLVNLEEDLVCIKKTNTGTGYIEVHILEAGSGYKKFKLQTATPLQETDHAIIDFQIMRNNNLVAIKRAHTGSGRTEVHTLSETSNYQNFVLQTATILHETPPDGETRWQFVVDSMF